MGRSRISTSYTKHTNLIYKMATIVVLGGTIKADKKADFVAYCKEAVANCKAANGCEWAKGCIDTEDNSKFAIFQKWTDDGARKAFAEKVKSERVLFFFFIFFSTTVVSCSACSCARMKSCFGCLNSRFSQIM